MRGGCLNHEVKPNGLKAHPECTIQIKHNKALVQVACTMYTSTLYRALLVTCQRLEAWLSCYVECHHGNASLNQVTTTLNLIKALYNLFKRPQLQTKSFPIPYFN